MNTNASLNNNRENKRSNVLAEIVEYKKSVVAQRKHERPLESFKKRLVKSTRSLEKALSNSRSDFILECKKASPSKGLIRKDFNLADILDCYKDYASAISILTDEKYFQGDLNYIAEATARVKQPILCKDFFIDPYQVFEARYFGADAILLMLSVLTDDEYKALAEIAESLSLDVLTEVHDEQEAERAQKLGAKIIGINNRDLRDLSIDLATTEKIAPVIAKNTPNAIIISESGVETHQDIKRLKPYADGFLIGSSIMAENDLRYHCKKLLFGNVKICGLTRKSDAIAVDANGANYGGLIFYPPSPRFVTLDVAREIVSAAPLRYVGVFVNEALQVMVDTAKALDLYAVQLHGNESQTTILDLRKLLDCNGLKYTKIWKAIHVESNATFQSQEAVDRYLLDKFDPAIFGGTGQKFDWSLLDSVDTSELILAGGINHQNLADLGQYSPYAIDLSSSVESAPGIKSEEKIETLFSALRA